MLNLPILKNDTLTNSLRIIPVIFNAGNHDLGINSYSGATVLQNNQAPTFKHFYPQNTQNYDVPNLKYRNSYFAHNFGDKLTILSLDAGYESPMEGIQSEWIERVLSDSKASIKMAQYHGPIYTACKQDSPFDESVIEAGLRNWIPLFDRYNMTIVFENHTHAFKRSKRIKYGVVNERGTIYLGEGMWGVEKPDPI